MGIDDMETTRVLLADDQLLFREALTCALESRSNLSVVGHSSSNAETRRIILEKQPHVVLIEVDSAELNALDVMRSLGNQQNQPKFLVVSSCDRSEMLIRAIRGGAAGYFLRSSSLAKLFKAIDEVRSGKHFFDQSIFDQLVREVRDLSESGPTDSLTPRESQVLRHVAEGLSTKEIAGHLAISSKTVRCHRARLMEKLDAHKVASLVDIAAREGLVSV
jgi:DNA-binding NarL/FixJ family response regulator